MFSYWILYFYVTSTTVLCCVNKGGIFYSIKLYLFIVLLIVLTVFAGLRGYNVDADSINYINWFNEIDGAGGVDLYLMKDPAFYLISYFLSGFGFGASYLFLIYSSIAVWSKFIFSKLVPYSKYTHYFLYLYFCRFYFPHDMTQIRAGVAIGICSLALVFLFNGKKYLSFFLLFLATTFHLSVVLMIPFFLLLIIRYEFKSRLPLLFALITAYIVSLYSNEFFEILGFSDFIRVASYLNGEYGVEKISLISVYFLTKIFLLSFIVCCRWNFSRHFDRLVVFLVATGMFLQVVFLNNDALALRSAEVFSIFDLVLFLIPLSFLSKNLRVVYFFAIIFLGGGFFISSLKIMKPYEWYFS